MEAGDLTQLYLASSLVTGNKAHTFNNIFGWCQIRRWRRYDSGQRSNTNGSEEVTHMNRKDHSETGFRKNAHKGSWERNLPTMQNNQWVATARGQWNKD